MKTELIDARHGLGFVDNSSTVSTSESESFVYCLESSHIIHLNTCSSVMKVLLNQIDPLHQHPETDADRKRSGQNYIEKEKFYKRPRTSMPDKPQINGHCSSKPLDVDENSLELDPVPVTNMNGGLNLDSIAIPRKDATTTNSSKDTLEFGLKDAQSLPIEKMILNHVSHHFLPILAKKIKTRDIYSTKVRKLVRFVNEQHRATNTEKPQEKCKAHSVSGSPKCITNLKSTDNGVRLTRPASVTIDKHIMSPLSQICQGLTVNALGVSGFHATPSGSTFSSSSVITPPPLSSAIISSQSDTESSLLGAPSSTTPSQPQPSLQSSSSTILSQPPSLLRSLPFTTPSQPTPSLQTYSTASCWPTPSQQLSLSTTSIQPAPSLKPLASTTTSQPLPSLGSPSYTTHSQLASPEQHAIIFPPSAHPTIVTTNCSSLSSTLVTSLALCGVISNVTSSDPNSVTQEPTVSSSHSGECKEVIDLTDDDVVMPPAPPFPDISDESPPALQSAAVYPRCPKLNLSVRSISSSGIHLSWNGSISVDYQTRAILQYQLYVCDVDRIDDSPWKRIGTVKAMSLPMACTLTSLTHGRYYLAIRGKDTSGVLGEFSDPKPIVYS